MVIINNDIRIASERYLECHAGYAGLAEGGDDVDAEEGHPAEQEGAHDDAHGDGCLVVTDVVGRAGVSHGSQVR